MSIIVMFEARCSFCPALFSMGRINVELVNVTRHQFIRQLRLEGWSVGKRVTCPDCAEAGRHRDKVRLQEWSTETQARLNRDAAI